MSHWQKSARNRVLEQLRQRQGLEASDPRTPLLAPILRIGDPPQPADHQDTTCDNTFGAPNLISCLQALQELESFQGNLDLDPAKSGPQTTRIGNCAIAIGFERVVTVGWNMARSVVESLFERYFQSPLASKGSGGITFSTASEGASSPFPAGMEVAIYEERDNQSATTKLPTSTCAWGVISCHRGDIRKCPA